jgi:immunity protein 5 of polymorphic toxin system
MRLDEPDHRSLVLWTAECAEHVLPYFEEQCPKDNRPRNALEAGRAWVRGEITMSEARAAALAAHAAARDADQGAPRAAARAAGHAAATAHVASHAAHAANYAVKAASSFASATAPTDSAAATKERGWQYGRLPEHLRPAVALPARGNN